jgi:hypothetical protein
MRRARVVSIQRGGSEVLFIVAAGFSRKILKNKSCTSAVNLKFLGSAQRPAMRTSNSLH